MLEFISLEQAQELILAGQVPGGSEVVMLKQALGRVLAHEVRASLNIPPFDRSAMDGYALGEEDLSRDAPFELEIVGEVPAGHTYAGEIGAGSAVKVLTGSLLPCGATAVVRQEDALAKPGLVQIVRGTKSGANISRQGEDIAAGELLFSVGTRISPAVLGVLASQGIDRVQVFRTPRIAVISSGDELRNVGSELGPGQIYNSNLYTVSGLIAEWGGEPYPLGLSRDCPQELGKVIRTGLAQADLVVTTGGASVGEYDVTLRALEYAGVTPLFWRVAMKPGTPVLGGKKQGILVLGLSGNPAAAMISAALLLGPAVRKLAGFAQCYPKKVLAVSQGNFNRRSGVTRLIRARVDYDATRLVTRFPDQQQPGVLKSMLNTNALVVIPPGCSLAAGDTCTAYLLNDWEVKA